MNTITYSPKNKSGRLLVNLLIIYFYVFVAFAMSYILTNHNLKTSLFYCSVILFAVLFASFAELSQSNKLLYGFFMFLSFFTLFFVYGFRDFSGIDDPVYLRIFEQIAHNGMLDYFKYSTMEPGYLILNKVVSIFTDNYLYMQLISSFIPLFLFYYGFNKYKRIISLPTAVFLLCTMIFFQMLAAGLVRMFIALGIVFLAFRFIPQQQPKRYVFYILLATLFHYSSFFLIFLVYFAINKNNLSKRTKQFYTIIFVSSPILFIFISRFIVPMLGSRYRGYGTLNSINLSIGDFTTLPLIFLLLFFYKKIHDNRKRLFFKLFIFVYSLSLIIFIFGDLIGIGRLIFYSYAAFILGVAMIVKEIRFNTSKIVFFSIIIFYGFLYVFYSQFANQSHIPFLFPYENIFFSI